MKTIAPFGSFSGLDRTCIFINDYDQDITTNIHEWCASGIDPQIDNLNNVPLDHLSDLLEPHQRGEIYKKVFTETEITLLKVFAELIANIEEQRIINESMQFQLQFGKMVSDISSYFISLPTGALGDGINRTIELTGKLLMQSSRASLSHDAKSGFYLRYSRASALSFHSLRLFIDLKARGC